uniref:Actin n=1 Tax=Aureoumbra lagunensis TaxID=44058 RepID=A0A7S3JS19_9STRA|mmetsp:Transcript_9021/g.13883  ORF Transcript_9021/g.13883 Transcript_9021/m.13883 type:complete len:401 (+) Transcript_9021:45-1247(+)
MANTGTRLLSQPVVMDNGTGFIKAGMAGGDRPNVVFANAVGRAKHVRMMPGGALEGIDVAVGDAVRRHRGALILNWPMARGMVEDWADMERVWSATYSNLGVSAENHPLLLTEAPLNASRHREKCAQLLFEHFNAPALFMAPQAILSLYASGRTTGLVLDVGDGLSHAVPVYEGFAIPHAVTRIDIGGRDITERLSLLLRRAGRALCTSAELDLCREIKEKCCYLATDPAQDERTMATIARRQRDTDISAINIDNAPDAAPRFYELPDGTRITLGPERFRAPEILFSPSVLGAEDPGLAKVLHLAASKADLDLRSSLYSQIVLAGGSTLFPGFGDRLLSDLKHLAPPHTKLKIHAPPERLLSTWIGGSILASLATFNSMWVLRAEYEENGPHIFSTRALA